MECDRKGTMKVNRKETDEGKGKKDQIKRIGGKKEIDWLGTEHGHVLENGIKSKLVKQQN